MNPTPLTAAEAREMFKPRRTGRVRGCTQPTADSTAPNPPNSDIIAIAKRRSAT